MNNIYGMKWIKTFESFDKDRQDLFLTMFQYISDEHNLSEIEDPSFLRMGFMNINKKNFEEGYFYNAIEAMDPKSKYITTNRDMYVVHVIKKCNKMNPTAYSWDQGINYFKVEYPELYDDLIEYISQMKSLHPYVEYEFSSYIGAILARGVDLQFYDVKIKFEFRKLKKSEMPHYRTLNMLRSINLSDEEKKSLKDLGFEI